MKPIILDLCGGTGAWSRPYAQAGYDVCLVTLPDIDVRTYIPPEGVPISKLEREHSEYEKRCLDGNV